jgi:hypothetical protein
MNPFFSSLLEMLVTKLLVFLGPGLNAAGIVIPDIGHTANLVVQALITLGGVVWGVIAHNRAIDLGASNPVAVATKPKVSLPTATIAVLLIPCLGLYGCTAAQFNSGLTEAESAAWTAANALETVNTATGGTLTTALVDYALTSTHNSGDEAVVNAAAAEANKVIAAQAAAKVAGLSASGQQAVTTAALTDPNVIAVGAAAATAPTHVAAVPAAN